MGLVDRFSDARRDELVARIRRVLVLRAMSAAGMSQREIALAVGISQPAVSQQLKASVGLSAVHPRLLLDAAGPVLRELAQQHGYTRLAVFGSVARGEAGLESDVDLLVESPAGTSTFGLLRFKRQIEQVLGRTVDLVDYGGLKDGLDDDIRSEAVLL